MLTRSIGIFWGKNHGTSTILLISKRSARTKEMPLLEKRQKSSGCKRSMQSDELANYEEYKQTSPAKIGLLALSLRISQVAMSCIDQSREDDFMVRMTRIEICD